jgi:hypothetical protein
MMMATLFWELAGFPLLMPMHFLSAARCTSFVHISDFCQFLAISMPFRGST